MLIFKVVIYVHTNNAIEKTVGNVNYFIMRCHLRYMDKHQTKRQEQNGKAGKMQ